MKKLLKSFHPRTFARFITARWLLSVAGILFIFFPHNPAIAQRFSTASAEGLDEPVAIEDLKTLAATIENDQERGQLLAQIRALIAVQDRISPAALDRPFSQRLVEAVSNTKEKFSMALQSLDGFMPDGKTVSAWVRNYLLDSQNVMRSSRHALPILLILLLAWIAELSAIRLSAGYQKRIEDRARRTHRAPVGPALARAAWRLFAPALFVIVALTGFVFVRPEIFGLKIAVQAITVYVAGRMFIIMARMVLAPEIPALRLAPLKTDSARSLFQWIRRLVLVALFGYLLVSTGRLLGMTATAASILLDGLAFVLLFMLIVCILGNRARVAAWLRGPDQDPTPSLSAGRRIHRRLAGAWHVLAIVYLVAAFGVWRLDIPGGFIYLARGTVLSGLVLFLARIAVHATRSRIAQTITASRKVARRFPILAQRVKRYTPIVFSLIRSGVVLIAAVAILEAWGVDAHRWLAGAHAVRFLGFFFSMLLVATIAAVTWETVNIATEHYLAKSEKPDATPTHSARLRTLLPLIRKALLILKARIKTRTIRQWAVGREFNRRMKKRFDELGIEFPFPHRTIYFGAGKDGAAPPVHKKTELQLDPVEAGRNAK
jgi:small conductance mechanosensitive channel